MLSSVWNFLCNISKPYEGESPEKIENELVSKDWSWVLNPEDEKMLNLRNQQIQQEIQNLQRNRKLIRSRNVIRAHCQTLICSLPEEKRIILEQRRLPMNTLCSIIRNLVETLAPKWQKKLAESFPEHHAFFEKDWTEQKYEKNLHGQLIALPTCASRSIAQEGLNERRLCDVVWSIRVTLKSIISMELQRSLTPRELHGIDHFFPEAVRMYFGMYVESIVAIGDTAERLGILPELYKSQDEREEIRLKELKLAGKVDAKYNKDAPIPPPVPIEKESFKEAQDALFAHLSKRYLPTKKPTKQPVSEETPNKSEKDIVKELFEKRFVQK